jgi:LuxR family transcriptional regulator, maltose regulon positive regulatory protein
VLRYLPTMLTVSEIAAELDLSANTVKVYMKSIYAKLHVSRRQEAVIQAWQRGLL